MTDTPPPQRAGSITADLNQAGSTTVPPPNAVETKKDIVSPPADNPFKLIGKATEQNLAKLLLDQLTTYYDSALKEKRKGFIAASIISFLGFLFFGFSFYLLWEQSNKATDNQNKIVEFVLNKAVVENVDSQEKPKPKFTINNAFFANANAAVANANTATANVATTSVICGALLEFVALATFYFYGRGFTDLQDYLDINQRFLLANNICEGMENESRQKAQAKLVESLLEYGLKNQEQQNSKDTAAKRAVNNNSSANQSSENPTQRN